MNRKISYAAFCITAILIFSTVLFGCSDKSSEPEAEKGTAELSYSVYAVNYEAEYKILDGALYGKGKNNLRLFGEDSSEFCKDWVKIIDANNIIHVEAVNGTVIYLTADGKVYGMGNSEGVFNTEYTVISEHRILLEDCKYAALGAKFVLFLKKDNTLWFLGESKNGQGTQVKDRIASPIKIAEDITFAKAFGYTSAWINDRGTLYMCGDNSYGQIGNGVKGCGLPTLYKDIVSTPYAVLENCVSFSAVAETSVKAETDDGTVYMWGGDYGSKPEIAEK